MGSWLKPTKPTYDRSFLHKNIRKNGTISNTLDAVLTLTGTTRRK